MVVTIGNFDGCHLGHQTLVHQAQILAGSGEVACLTFSPRPAVFFGRTGGDAATSSLFTDGQKAEAMAELGVHHCIFQPFDREFSELSRENFFALVREIGCRGIVVGDDFRFGAGRSGDVHWLSAACAKANILFSKVDPVSVNGVRASSSAIRREIALGGNMELAGRLLGRDFALDGEIIAGARNGRRIGVPTANLKPLDQILPRTGVYAGHFACRGSGYKPCLLSVDRSALPCVVNVGYRPTVDVSGTPGLSIEAHVIDHNIPLDSLYGHDARIYFAARLRNEMKFSSVEQLKEQITRDIAAAKQLLSEAVR